MLAGSTPAEYPSPVGQATLEKRLAHEMGRCIADFELITSGDRVMVAISGGKDSYTLLHLLDRARQRAPVPFELVAVHLDQGQPGYDGRRLEAWLRDHGYEHHIIREDTYQIVTKRIPEGKTYCSMCSRLRRGILYNPAEQTMSEGADALPDLEAIRAGFQQAADEPELEAPLAIVDQISR